MPFLHYKGVGDVELVKNKVEDIDIISGGLPLAIYKLKRTEVPVADNNQWLLICIAEVV